MMNNQTQVNVLGQLYTVEQFALQETEGDISHAIATIEYLMERGQAEVITERQTKEEKAIERAMKEKSTLDRAEYVRQEEEDQLDKKANSKKEGRLLHDEIRVAYFSLKEAKNHKALFEENLRLEGISIQFNEEDDTIELVIPNVSDKDVDFISRRIKTDAIVGGAVTGIDKGITGTTKVVDYTAKNILSPTVKIATKGVVSIGRTLFSTVSKAGATLISAGSEGARRTASELNDDDDILKAKQELINAKNGIRRGFNSKVGATSSRIKY